MSTKAVVIVCSVAVYLLVLICSGMILRKLDRILENACGGAQAETATEGFGAVDAGDQTSSVSDDAAETLDKEWQPPCECGKAQAATAADEKKTEVAIGTEAAKAITDKQRTVCEGLFGGGDFFMLAWGKAVLCVIPYTEGNAFAKFKIDECVRSGGTFIGQTNSMDVLCDLSGVK